MKKKLPNCVKTVLIAKVDSEGFEVVEMLERGILGFDWELYEFEESMDALLDMEDGMYKCIVDFDYMKEYDCYRAGNCVIERIDAEKKKGFSDGVIVLGKGQDDRVGFKMPLDSDGNFDGNVMVSHNGERVKFSFVDGKVVADDIDFEAYHGLVVKDFYGG